MSLKQRGVTLIEVLIAVSLFSVIAVISSNILIDIVQLEKKTSVQNAMYDDLRLILQQLTNEIQNGQIDYEEYFNHHVLYTGIDTVYGVNYGVYGSRFYDPQITYNPDDNANPQDLGWECSKDNGSECEIVYTDSIDLSTGANPFEGSGRDAANSNAFCDDPYKTIDCTGWLGLSDHLFLLDRTGTEKTIITTRSTQDSDRALAMVKMEGLDIDQNGIVDSFRCKDEYVCNPLNITDLKIDWSKITGDANAAVIAEHDLTSPKETELAMDYSPATSAFVPISPLKTNIENLQFIINPVEDPFKAYSEDAVQYYPTVTIIITVGLSEDTAEDYPGDFEPITVQTTVAAGVFGEIQSYPPVNEVKLETLGGWLDSWITGTNVEKVP